MTKVSKFDGEIIRTKTEYAHQTFSRALPYMLDGFQESYRRIMYVMYKERVFDLVKSSTVVGMVNVYHPHGEMSIYNSIVTLVRPYSVNHPLIELKGNKGNLEDDTPASSRYTDIKLSAFARDIIDVDEVSPHCIDFMQAESDPRKSEPAYLPIQLPLALLQGHLGIAEGITTSLPPFNLREVCDACVRYIEASIKGVELNNTQLWKGIYPDFPTGGIITNKDTLDAFIAGETDSESVTIKYQPEVTVHPEKNVIVFESMPYKFLAMTIKEVISATRKKLKTSAAGVDLNMSNLLQHMADLDPNDLTYCKYRFHIKPGVDLERMKETLMKVTNIRRHLNWSCVLATQDYRRPVILMTPKDIIKNWHKHRSGTILRKNNNLRQKMDIDKRKLEGKLAIYDHTDDVLQIIRSAETGEKAQREIERKYKLSEIQSHEIMNTNLRALSKMGKPTLVSLINNASEKIDNLRESIKTENINAHIIQRIKYIADKYGRERQTKVTNIDTNSKTYSSNYNMDIHNSVFATNSKSLFCSKIDNLMTVNKPFHTMKSPSLGLKNIQNVFASKYSTGEVSHMFIIGDDFVRKDTISPDKWAKPNLNGDIITVIPDHENIQLIVLTNNFTKIRRINLNEEINQVNKLIRFKTPFNAVIPCEISDDKWLVVVNGSKVKRIPIEDIPILSKYSSGNNVHCGEGPEPKFCVINDDENIVITMNEIESRNAKITMMDELNKYNGNRATKLKYTHPKIDASKLIVESVMGVPNPNIKDNPEVMLICDASGFSSVKTKKFRFYKNTIAASRMRKPITYLTI